MNAGLQFTMAVMSDVTIEQLFAKTLQGDYEDDSAWDAVHKLRKLGTREVFDVAARWCASENALERARGLDVLAQIGKTVDHPANGFPNASYALVVNAINHEVDLLPLNSAIAALGHLENPAAVPLIAQFHLHKCDLIRFSVAFALGSFPNDPLSVSTLLKLMEDSDEEVRDWATFSLSVLGDQDSSAIRDALVTALADADKDVSEEALVGLAKRHDTRVLEKLLTELQQSTVTSRVIEAAYTLLEMPDEKKDWLPRDYTKALNERFQLR